MPDQSEIKLTDAELLKLAKGISFGELTAEQIKERDIINWTHFFTEEISDVRDMITRRKHIRRLIFRILKKRVRGKDLDLSEQILTNLLEKQLNPNLALTWDNFTFTWDLAPKGLKLVQKDHWTQEGGGFDEVGYYPVAFTKQVID